MSISAITNPAQFQPHVYLVKIQVGVVIYFRHKTCTYHTNKNQTTDEWYEIQYRNGKNRNSVALLKLQICTHPF